MYDKKMNLEDKLYRHIPVQNAGLTADVFGVEVELEGKNIVKANPVVHGYWHQHNDGSLRKKMPGDECIEYVFAQPYNLKTTQAAIEALFSYLNSPDVTVYESYRTSIHVHVNFAVETFRTVFNFMALSLIMDELFVSQNGEHRIGNNFCLRAKDAMGQVVSLIQSVQQKGNFFNMHVNDRYSSINFVSLLKFGTIEFRSLECTTHTGRVMHWINTLQRLKEVSRTFNNPAEIIRKFSQLGPERFLDEILGPYAIKYMDVRERDRMLRDGVRIAQDFAFCATWKELDFIKPKAEELPKQKLKHVPEGWN